MTNTRHHAALVLATALAILLTPTAGLASGAVDPTFGVDGLVRFDRPNLTESASDMAIDSQGRIYISFEVSLTGIAEYWPAVIRLMPDGLPDTSFGSSGFWLESTYRSDSLLSIAVDSADRLLVGWSHEFVTDGIPNEDWVVRRLKTDGTNDLLLTTAFDLGSGQRDDLRDLLFTADDRLVGVGRAQFGAADDDFAVAVWRTNGNSLELDPTFSSDGKRTIAFDVGGTKADLAKAVIQDDAGRLVVVGEAATADGKGVAVCRLLTSGDLDESFSGDGKTVEVFDPFDQPPWERNDGRDVVQRPGGGYYVAAFVSKVSTDLYRSAVLALDASGSPSLAFGNVGWAVPDFPAPPGFEGDLSRLGYSLLLDPENRILLAGLVSEFSFDQKTTAFLLRLTDQGGLDSELSGDGVEYYDFSPPGQPQETSFQEILLVDSGRKLLVAGSTSGLAVPDPDDSHIDVMATRLHITSEIFADGFESGNLSAWSSAVP